MTRLPARSCIATFGVLALGATTAPALSSAAAMMPTAKPAGHVRVQGLDGPIGIQFTADNTAVVANGDVGQVVRVNTVTGAKKVLVSGAGGVAGVAESNGVLYAALAGPNENGKPTPGKFPPSSLLKANADGSGVHVFADLLAYEIKHNPDGQVQLVKGKPVDALSNPFSINASKYGLFIADGGANDVLRVNRDTGAISTFFVPPTAKTKACLAKGAQANPGTVGCDPVPTGIAVARGHIFISTLGAESPGAGRVYELTPSGKFVRSWHGLTSPTGIAVTGDGTIFVSEVTFGAPQGDGPPPPGFNPAAVGRITRIAPNGTMTHAQVTMPTGLTLNHGHLYASTWSIASFLGIKHAGQVVWVPQSAFK